MNKDKTYITTIYTTCPVHLTRSTEGVVVDYRLRNVYSSAGISRGYKLCDKCADKVNNGYIAIVELNDSERDALMPVIKRARTGKRLWLTLEQLRALDIPKPKLPFIFVTEGSIDNIDTELGDGIAV